MKRKILIVDDDAELVELLTFNFKRAGFAVATAGDGVEALRKACSISPDLILLDLMLPELDGFAVCETLRRDAATASIPVIMLTALSGELGRLTGLGCGAAEYMTKPFSPPFLISHVEKLLKRARGLDEQDHPKESGSVSDRPPN
jgi:DNA-binding response OmpR family regulator